MTPLKYSNFLVAATAVLPFLSPLFLSSSLCYYFTTVQHNKFTLSLNFQGGGEVH